MRPTSVTSPTGTPKKLTGAPTERPRTDSVKYITYRVAIDSSTFIARRRGR